MNILRLSRQPLFILKRTLVTYTSSPIVKRNGLSRTQKSMVYTPSFIRHPFHTTVQQLGVKSFLLADIGEGITECELIQWFVEPGQTVAEFDKICEVQSDKASVEITSRYSGKITKLYHDVHDIAKVGQPLVDIEAEGDQEQCKIEDITPMEETPTTLHREKHDSFMAPSVRRLVLTNNIKITDVKGTGKGGRILKENILDHLNRKLQVDGSTLVDTTMPIKEGEDTTTSLSMIQKTMFKTMTQSLTIPQLGYKDEIELDATTQYRSSLNDHITKHQNMYPFTKISYLPIFIKSLSIALSYYPIMNAMITGDQKDVNSLQLIYRGSHNVGVAMDTPQGLIVPNIKNVQSKTIFEVAAELHRLVELGKTNAIPLEDLQNGTITLSNIGTISGTYANPVIVSSELAIVALGKMQKLPRFDQAGQVVSKEILPISWSADHRIIDGATVARFGNTWKTLIENPALLTSELR